MAVGSYSEGSIYLVPDAKLRFTPQGNPHATRRPFLILTRENENLRNDWPVVFGCPISSQTTWTTAHDFPLRAGTAGLQKKSWVRIPMSQSILKADLEDYQGCLSPADLETARALLARYIGLG